MWIHSHAILGLYIDFSSKLVLLSISILICISLWINKIQSWIYKIFLWYKVSDIKMYVFKHVFTIELNLSSLDIEALPNTISLWFALIIKNLNKNHVQNVMAYGFIISSV